MVKNPFTKQNGEKESERVAGSAFHPAVKVPGTRPEMGRAGQESAEKFSRPMRIAIIIGLGMASWTPILLLIT